MRGSGNGAHRSFKGKQAEIPGGVKSRKVMEKNFTKMMKTWQIENLVGKIMLIIETIGLQKNQEESAKSLIKQSIWTEFNEGIFISKDMCEKAIKENEKEGFQNLS